MPAPTPTRADRRLLVAGNWKMNGDRASARRLAASAAAAAAAAPEVDVAVFPPFVHLTAVAEVLGSPGGVVALGGQGCHWEAPGAHTSGVCAGMLVEAGCRYVLCGHSEVRRELGFDDARVRATAGAATAGGLRPIVCVGESRTEREAGRAAAVVTGQVDALLTGFPGGAGVLDIAYEPVWAIGTGLSASPAQAAEAHAWIRSRLDAAGGGRSRILYGGSVSPANIDGFLSQPGVDGVLVGGQSLDAAAFAALVAAARSATGHGRRS